VAKSADAAVVGSAIVRQIGEIGDQPDLAERVAAFVKPLADAAHG
jgi:tryptophan synthase alpha chain